MATPFRLRAWTIGCWLTLAACNDDTALSLPEAPDMTGVVMSYENPTGVLAGQDVGCLAQEALARMEVEAAEGMRKLVTDALQSLREWLDASGLPTAPVPADSDEPRVQGRAQIFRHLPRLGSGGDHPRRGHQRPHPPERDFRHPRLAPGGVGRATNCLGRVDIGPRSINLFLNADLAIHLYRGLRAGEDATFALRMKGEGGTETERHPIDTDFRTSTASLDIRLAQASGEIVASLKQGLIELRGRDGVVAVDPARITCSATPDGGPARPR